MTALLPPDYAVLEPFAARWCGETLGARAALRDASTADERAAFYEAAAPLAAAAMASVGGRSLDRLDAREARLLQLMLGFVHVALATEIQAESEPAHAIARAHMRITAAAG